MKQPKNQWGLVIGRPTRLGVQEAKDLNLSVYFLQEVLDRWIYNWDGDQPYLALFDTREEARKAAKRLCQTCSYFYLHPKKYIP
jgi:hypothetical protein